MHFWKQRIHFSKSIPRLNFFSGGTLTDYHNYCVQSVEKAGLVSKSNRRCVTNEFLQQQNLLIVLLFSNYVILNQNLTQVTVSKHRASLVFTGNKYKGETKLNVQHFVKKLYAASPEYELHIKRKGQMWFPFWLFPFSKCPGGKCF